MELTYGIFIGRKKKGTDEKVDSIRLQMQAPQLSPVEKMWLRQAIEIEVWFGDEMRYTSSKAINSTATEGDFILEEAFSEGDKKLSMEKPTELRLKLKA